MVSESGIVYREQIEELGDVLAALGVAGAGGIRVRQLVDDRAHRFVRRRQLASRPRRGIQRARKRTSARVPARGRAFQCAHDGVVDAHIVKEPDQLGHRKAGDTIGLDEEAE